MYHHLLKMNKGGEGGGATFAVGNGGDVQLEKLLYFIEKHFNQQKTKWSHGTVYLLDLYES